VATVTEAKAHQNSIVQSTRMRIIEEARSLFSEYSFLGVSMADIAQRLNITKAALYYHFASKADLYENVLDDVLKRLSLAITEAFSQKTNAQKLKKLVNNYLEFGFSEKNLVKALLLKFSPGSSEVTERIIGAREQISNQIRPLVNEILKEKNLAKKTDSRLVTSLLLGMMDGLLLEYSLFDKEFDSEKVADQIVNILF
jgi:AcrR family transcriptional regulator